MVRVPSETYFQDVSPSYSFLSTAGPTDLWRDGRADVGNDFVTFVYDPKGAKANAFNNYRLRHIPK